MTNPRPLRRDAQRNRDLLVAAARRVYAARGLDVPLEDVAREAGVSIGTLYNRFPTRGALVEAALADKVAGMVEQAETAAAMADPWDGFAWFLERCCEVQAADRGYNELCARTLPDTPEIDRLKARGHELVLTIVDRAQRSGQLRADFQEGDFAFVLWSTTTTIDATAATAPDAWRRHLGFILDGFRVSAAHPLPAPPLGPDEVAKAMRMNGG
ncbi:TetR/AcrR family transcriptional regulator [Actinophytocola sp.]|uniref:TetR/AcrR family transcriptional regulator n=1 Tax=Actinophytocola sp. TaxID=1872138 RepID=UPI002ED08B5F